MTFIPVPGTALAELVCSLDGQRCESTLYFNKAGAWTVADLEAMATALISWWTANLAPLMSTAVTFLECKVTDLTTDTGSAFIKTPAAALAGGNSGAPGPNNVAFVVKFLTTGRGRSSRGRNYVYGFSEADVGISHMSSVLAGQFVAAYTALFAVATAQGVEWVVASRFHNKAPRAEGVSIPITTVSFTDLVTDSQRRRLPGRGT